MWHAARGGPNRDPAPASLQEDRGAGPLNAIEIDGLIKRYGSFTAVDGVTLSVEEGDFFGFLGPNGAGKTTTINAIVGLAVANAGTVKIFGHDTVRDWRRARPLVGLAPQEYTFDRYLSIRDVLIYQAGYFGLRGPALRARADALLERFAHSEKADQVFTRLSGGMKRRLTLARALIHDPRLIILDEPTAGVDVELRLELWDWLRELNASGTTIFLTTHYLEEAETLCKHIAIIESGRIVTRETTRDLVAQGGEAMLAVTVDRPLRALPAGITVAGSLDAGGRTARFAHVEPGEVAAILNAFTGAGFTIEDLDFTHSTLQDVFLELTRR